MQSLLLNIFMNMKKTNKRMINKPYLINDSIKKINHFDSDSPLTCVLPVIEIKSAVGVAASSSDEGVIFSRVIIGGWSRGGNYGVIRIKMNTNFERNSPGTGGSWSCYGGSMSRHVENCPANSID